MQGRPDSWWSYAVPAVVIAVVMALRWRRMSRARPLKLERLWILPSLYAVLAVVMFATRPPVGWGWMFCALALVAGAALGWQRGRMMRITVDPDSHALNHSASPAAMLFLLAIVLVRQGLRAPAVESAIHLDPLAATDMLVALALGLFTAMRIEMFLRGRRLLAAARLSRP